MSKNRLGLVVGAFLALIHLVWSVAVAAIPETLTTFIAWVLRLHHVAMSFTIEPFVLSNAITLIALTFVVGYIIGWVLGVLIKVVGKKR